MFRLPFINERQLIYLLSIVIVVLVVFDDQFLAAQEAASFTVGLPLNAQRCVPEQAVSEAKIVECKLLSELMNSGTFLGHGGNKLAYRAFLGSEPVVVKKPRRHEEASNRFPPMYWVTKSMRNFELERQWLTRLTGKFAVRFFGSNFDCGLESGSIVEYVPVNVQQIVIDLLPIMVEKYEKMVPCVTLSIANQMLELLQWLALPEPKSVSGQRSIIVCDWKLDQFGFTWDFELKLLDVDSLHWYHQSLPFLATSKCRVGLDKRRSGTSCMGPAECFQHGYRLEERAPDEFWCNDSTGFCDGFDERSNVWGLGFQVFRRMFNGTTMDTFEPSLASKVKDIIEGMMTDDRFERATRDDVTKTFQSLFEESGGDQCLSEFKELGGLKYFMSLDEVRTIQYERRRASEQAFGGTKGNVLFLNF